MIETTFIVKYLGILMLVMGVVGIARHKLIQLWLKRALVRPSVFFLIGIFEFMLGLLIVVGHQKWGSFSAGLVTVLGWLAIIESMLYLTLPKGSIMHLLGRVDRSGLVIATSVISIGLGVVLTLSGFQVI
jgi:hypothetical protein